MTISCNGWIHIKPIINIVSSIPTYCEVYSIQHEILLLKVDLKTNNSPKMLDHF
jgi:hypothetical protein